MKWHDLQETIGQRSSIEVARRPEFAYARIEIDLGLAEYVGTDIPLSFSGDQLAKIKYTGTNTGTYFRLNDRHAQQIYASEFKRSNIPFTKIYLTNPVAQTGKILSFYIGTGVFAAVQPSLPEIAALADDLNEMYVVTLNVTTTGQTAVTNICAASGELIEIVGYNLDISIHAPTGSGGTRWLGFATSATYLWVGYYPEATVKADTFSTMSNIRIRGAEGEEISLKNSTFTGGGVKVGASVFYRIIKV